MMRIPQCKNTIIRYFGQKKTSFNSLSCAYLTIIGKKRTINIDTINLCNHLRSIDKHVISHLKKMTNNIVLLEINSIFAKILIIKTYFCPP